MTPTVVLSPRGEARLNTGHPWIYRPDVVAVRAGGGDFVKVLGPRAKPLGWALYSDRSRISLRMLARDAAPVPDALLRRRIEEAIAFRRTLAIEASAYRLVHAEADLLPSLIVDKYGDYLVLQTLSQGMDRLLPLVTLEGPFDSLPERDAKLAYAQSLSAVAFIVRRSSEAGIVRLLAALGDGLPSEEALPVALALSYPELQKAWSEQLASAELQPSS